MALNYDYAASKAYCEQIGLHWLGEDYWGLIQMDGEAHRLNFSQEQVDAGMRQHLWQVKILFTPKSYKFLQRFMITFYFLTGWKPKNG